MAPELHRCTLLLALVACAAPDGSGARRNGSDPTGHTGLTTPTGTPAGTVSGTATGTPTTPSEVTASMVAVGDSLGIRTSLPAWSADCAAAGAGWPCDDLDLDGLTDAWEDQVLEGYRPAVHFDEAEPLIDDPSAVLVDVGRVAPAADGLGAIRVTIMIGYDKDYGRCGFSAHNGDSERVALDLELVGPGDADALGFYTAAHEGTITDSGHVFTGAELAELVFETDPFTSEPRWVVFSSDGKHATYGTIDRCENAQWAPCVEEDCGADGQDPFLYTRLPEVFNAGEEAAPFLTDLGPIGFPGEDAWADQEFCGGLGGGLFGCASAVREKLLVDPFL